MILYERSVTMTENLREIVQAQAPDFPYAAMEADLNLYADRCVPWHWHDHFEFNVIHRGSVILQLERGSFLLREGDAYFANSNVLHRLRAAEHSQEACLRAQLFDRSLIAGTGLIGRRYTAPIEHCAALDAFILCPEQPGHAALLGELAAGFAAAEADTDGHELEICARLGLVWQGLFTLVQPMLKNSGAPSENTRRVKEMLTFIHDHYMQAISVREIAAAAGICERECYRCFSHALDTTPTEYLIRHRIDAAMRLLRESSLSIAEVAAACGFTDAGYFGRVFRRIMGCTPGQYRKS